MADSAVKQAQNVLSSLLIRERRKRNHTVRQASIEMDCAPQSVLNWEAGHLPIKEKLVRIAAYLNLPQRTVAKHWGNIRNGGNAK